MLINLGSDIPYIYVNSKLNFLERNKLEDQLPVFLFENKGPIYVIVGPGNFTTTRIGCQVINIYSWINKLDKIYYLNKFEFYNFLGYSDLYLFSGNKNKYLKLENNGNVQEILYGDIKEKTLLVEPLFDENNKNKFDNTQTPGIDKITAKYETIQWKEAAFVEPFYYFQPITSVSKKNYKKI